MESYSKAAVEWAMKVQEVILRQVTHHPGKLLEQSLARLHAQVHNRVLQIVDRQVHLARDAAHVFAVFAQCPHGRGQTVAQKHQLAHLVHDRVQAAGIDAERVLDDFRRLPRLSSGRGIGELAIWCGRWGNRFRRGPLQFGGPGSLPVILRSLFGCSD
jgi:hypothetical protein